MKLLYLFTHCVTLLVLGFAVSSFIQRAVTDHDPLYTIFGVCAAVALILNYICKPDEE